jgi:hypothetical protein
MTKNKEFTYADLIAYFHEVMPSIDLAQKRNRLSGLSQFQRHFGVTDGDLIGPVLGRNFEKSLSDFLNSRDQSQRGTIKNLKSYLRAWRKIYDELIAKRGWHFRTLHEAANHFYNLARTTNPQLTRTQLAKEAGLRMYDIERFLEYTDSVLEKTLPAIQRLEKALKAPTGSLTIFIKHVSKGIRMNPPQRSEYGKRNRTLCLSKYRLRADQFTLHLSKEWRPYFDFKTDDVVIGSIKRNKHWRLRPVAEAGLSSRWMLPHVTTADGKLYSATAQFRLGILCMFFGALAQIEINDSPGVKKYHPADFSLAWIADYDLVTESVGYLVERYGGVYTNTVHKVFLEAQTFLHPQFGYIRQKDHFRRKLITPVTEVEWSKWCDEQLRLINEHLRQLNRGKKFTQTRDPFLPIRDYIQNQHPITVLLDLALNLSRYIDSHPTIPTKHRRPLERTLFFVEVITEQPLRLKMFYLMTYFPDNTGNLYQRANGDWAIRFPKEAFKNEYGAAQKAYDVAFTKDLSTKVEKYIREILPSFQNERHLVFPSFPRRHLYPSRPNALEIAFRAATWKFLPGCKGFGPHAARHLVATDFIKNHASGWQTAADVLHDTLETVRKAYAFLQAEDGYKFYRAYLSDIRSQHSAIDSQEGRKP